MQIIQPERDESRATSGSKARDRIEARQRRQMATPRAAAPPPDAASGTTSDTGTTYRGADAGGYVPRERQKEAAAQEYERTKHRPRPTNRYDVWKMRSKLARRDFWWYLTRDTRILPAIIALCVVSVLAFAGLRATQGRIFPNVWALGVPLDNLTLDEAAAALQSAWAQMPITLADSDRVWQTTAPAIGLRLDARETAEAARNVGMGGVPFGYAIQPVIELDPLTAQNYLLDMTETTRIDPYNAGYRWEGSALVGVPGADGRFLDVARTMAELEAETQDVVEARRLDLSMSVLQPDILDSMPYLDQARQLASQPFTLTGYDPFTDEYLRWNPDRITFASWLEAGADGLTLRETPFAEFLDQKSREVNETDPRRFMQQTDSFDKLRIAIRDGVTSAQLRIRYRSTTYTVESGDTGYRISRRTGIPFYDIQQANPNRDWEDPLYVGEVVNLPSRDVTLPLDPVPNKRIVVNLQNQSMIAYENGQPVFQWLISSGMSTAPTFPGVYQILDHNEVALGSSYTLCGSTGCGAWTMYWFMGIYQTVPGLINGFHGAVLLPDGRYLGGGNVGNPYTFGCVMAENDNAEALYHWADQGTIVEIVSSEFLPQSELARQFWTQSVSADTL
ncbi:MAG: L,D-transpeptidase family protein [Chloroflexota bacterium]|nr:L,D-transpeptidase family protein [Chloroflexota bacterium]